MEEREWKIIHADDMADGIGEKLSRFLESFKSPEDDPVWSDQYYRWKIKENPVRTGFASLAVSGNDIVSSVSVTPKLIWYKGRKIRAAEIGDTYTDTRFQRRGIFAALINDIKVRAHESGCDLIYGLPNEQSRPGYEKKCNFVSHPTFKLESCTYLFNAAKIAGDNYAGFIKSILKILSLLLNTTLSVAQRFWLLVGKTFGISVEEIDTLDDRYDEFWQKNKDQSDILLVRDKNHLNFRFFSQPLVNYRFYEAKKRGKLLGYLVSRMQKSQGRRNALIADWFYDRRHPLVFLSLLQHALRDGVSQGVGLFSTWVNDSSVDKWLLFLSGFVARRRQPIIFHKNAMGTEILNSRDRWHFTIADSDNV